MVSSGLIMSCGGGLHSSCGAVSSLVGVGGSTGKVLSTFGVRVSSLILMGLLLSSFEGFQSTYFRELVSICSRRSSLWVLCPG